MSKKSSETTQEENSSLAKSFESEQLNYLTCFLENNPIILEWTDHPASLDFSEIISAAKASVRGGKGSRGALFATRTIEGLNKNRSKLFGKKVSRKVSNAIILIGTAIELFQSAMLVHDDIIDKDEFRRGIPSAYKTLGSEKAVILGDLLLTAADSCFNEGLYQLIMHKVINKRLLSTLSITWADMKKSVLFGQTLDIDQASLDINSINKSNIESLAEKSFNVNLLKTTSYTTFGPLLLSQYIINPNFIDKNDKETREFTEEISSALDEGEKFQLKNDSTDFEKDIKTGNISSLLLRLLSYYKDCDKEFTEILNIIKKGKNVTKSDIEALKSFENIIM